jgi:hypothetical protein
MPGEAFDISRDAFWSKMHENGTTYRYLLLDQLNKDIKIYFGKGGA